MHHSDMTAEDKKTYQIYFEEVDSFISSGYVKLGRSSFGFFEIMGYSTILRHPRNGNHVEVVCHLLERKVEVWKNGKKVKTIDTCRTVA